MSGTAPTRIMRATGSCRRAPHLAFRGIRVDTSSSDQEGRLVLADDHLVAVLVRLDGAEHGSDCGRWLLEAGFGRCADPPVRPFLDLKAAARWIRRRLGA
jgi:hypothetical protein